MAAVGNPAGARWRQGGSPTTWVLEHVPATAHPIAWVDQLADAHRRHRGAWRGVMVDERGQPVEYRDFPTRTAAQGWVNGELQEVQVGSGHHAGLARHRILREPDRAKRRRGIR